MQKYPRGLAVPESHVNVSISTMWKDSKLWDFVSLPLAGWGGHGGDFIWEMFVAGNKDKAGRELSSDQL